MALSAQSTRTSIPTIHAEHQEITENLLKAWDKVELAWEEYRIYADYMEYNQQTRVVIARGRVTMASNETVISGERLQFNLKERTGVLYDTFGQMPPTVRYKSNKLTQVDNETLKFDKIDFTSCAQCVPRWRITCSGGKIKKEKYIEMKHALLKIKKIPILYIPYFWAIKPNVDLTLSLDYYGKAGLGAAEELRYLFKSMEGNIKFYYFKYKPDVILEQGQSMPDDQFYTYNTSDYMLKATHQQRINFLNSKINIDIDRQSDANFLRLFSNDFYAVLARTARSSITLNSSFANVKLSVNASQYDTYYTFNNSSRTLRYLPRVTLNWNQQKIWKIPGYFSLNASYSGVQRIGKSFDIDEGLFVTDFKTNRIFISPTYSLSLVKTAWVTGKLTINTQHSIYPKSRDPETREIVDEPLHLQYQTARLDFQGPKFSKIYEFRNSKLKHLIVPGITFRYVTSVDEEDRTRLLPVDRFDYPSYSFVGFSLKNRLLVKKNNSNSPTEVFSHIISQDYYFDPVLANRNRKVNGIFPEFSELTNTIRIRPFKHFSMDASIVYNHFLDAESFMDNFTRLRFSMSYTNRKSFLYGNFNYSRYINQYASSTYIFNRDTVGGRLNFDIPRFPLKFDGQINYDITAKEFRHANFKLTYDYQCLRFNTELRLFKYAGRVETQFNVGISFGNLGVVKDFLGVDD
jgi:lipopolysaccharide assembly outer membrane protein LptD (OstA)